MFKHKITLKIIYKRIYSLILPFGTDWQSQCSKNVVFASRTLL
ncbi:hypothetical protein SC1083_0067 [Aggregatibacter actinomycetemcomitans serotype e str. SC1083]|uniref:Uncharacterized protein n=1 Tax=Aggregatibacter actinomycetemcomitans serotype e str. SC1083 TaxID=907488 RepID=G4A5I2_AGGAC|nr:hypothetical protein SC1083_0067 [Aggregatibacter actinomycetemcomitans serotype e str. SC1083]